ncbi:pentapeptide repeat-containing protein [Bordetella tumbae]|uniref:pentapeptide repeat-containing protein n=1 Tax=Bordetella tumbae TaxID=1649139 RepID=UPI0039F0E68A
MLDLNIEASRIEKLVVTGNHQVSLRFKDSTFAHLVLTDFDFKYLALENTAFTNLIALECVAKNYSFQGVQLIQSQFTDSDMAGSDFSHANLSQACFKGCGLQECRFDRADMRQALIIDANAAQAVFAGAQLECANLSGTNGERAVFRGANMTMTALNRCNLQYADFSDCSMEFTDFSYANISHADFRGGHFMRSKHHAVIDDGTRYGSKQGILPPDHELLRAEQWVKL